MEINQLIRKAQEVFTKEEFESLTQHLIQHPYDVVDEMVIASAQKENKMDLAVDDTAVLEIVESILKTRDQFIESADFIVGVEESIEFLLTEENTHCLQLPNFEPVVIRSVLLELLKHQHGELIVCVLLNHLKENADSWTYENVSDFPVLREYAK